jgi:hypothetical protein
MKYLLTQVILFETQEGISALQRYSSPESLDETAIAQSQIFITGKLKPADQTKMAFLMIEI